jgi:hypothetical protein
MKKKRKMTERKLPRSGLSEVLRRKADGVETSAGVVGVGGSTGVLRRISFGREEIGCEIKQIFSQNNQQQTGLVGGLVGCGGGGLQGNHQTIFGCSPPVRSRNPVVSDSKFWRETNRVEKLIAAPQIDSGLKDGLEKVVCTLSPPGGRFMYH